MASFKVIFRGVRGSHAMPGKSTVKYGGNTTCVELRVDDKIILLDAGTGIIKVGKELLNQSVQSKKPVKCIVLFTHMHHDHNEGLPFFQPMYQARSKIYMFGPDPLADNIRTVLFQSPYFPVDLTELPALKVLHSVVNSDTIVFENDIPRLVNSARKKVEVSDDEVLIKIRRGIAHPREGVFHYRIFFKGKSVSFCTDTEGYIGGDTGLINFVKGSDLLIHDAQYTYENYTSGLVPKQGFGHSTPQMAVEVAQKAGVRQLACTHHDPDSSDEFLDKLEEETKKEFANSFFAREDMVIEL